MQKRSNLIVMTLTKLSVLPHIIILDSATSCVPISVIETVYSEVPFEREQLASSNGRDLSDQVYNMHQLNLYTYPHYIDIGVGDAIVHVPTQATC